MITFFPGSVPAIWIGCPLYSDGTNMQYNGYTFADGDFYLYGPLESSSAIHTITAASLYLDNSGNVKWTPPSIFNSSYMLRPGTYQVVCDIYNNSRTDYAMCPLTFRVDHSGLDGDGNDYLTRYNYWNLFGATGGVYGTYGVKLSGGDHDGAVGIALASEAFGAGSHAPIYYFPPQLSQAAMYAYVEGASSCFVLSASPGLTTPFAINLGYSLDGSYVQYSSHATAYCTAAVLKGPPANAAYIGGTAQSAGRDLGSVLPNVAAGASSGLPLLDSSGVIEATDPAPKWIKIASGTYAGSYPSQGWHNQKLYHVRTDGAYYISYNGTTEYEIAATLGGTVLDYLTGTSPLGTYHGGTVAAAYVPIDAGSSVLAANGLDSISKTLPTSATGWTSWTFTQRLLMLCQFLFGYASENATQRQVMADDSATVISTQTLSDDGTTQTHGRVP